MSSAPERIVIVGGGLAGATMSAALRDQGFSGVVTLVSGESHLPYERPPLSKVYLAGTAEFDDAVVHPESWYRENDVELLRGVKATAIDTTGHRVRLADGSEREYDKLVLATGSVPRRLALPGSDASGVHYLRVKEDADAIRPLFGDGKSVAIIGGGWIGLETAAVAREAGSTVTVLERAETLLHPVLDPEIAEVFAQLHRSHGVEICTGAQVVEIATASGAVTGVRLATGEVIDAEAVLVGVGATPELELADQARLDTDNGVLVDAAFRSSDPDVYAIGDIANHDHPVLGYRVRVEHWANAVNQPATAAASILGDANAAYTLLPYFFTDQYDLGMEYCGHVPHGAYDHVIIRGDLGRREFIAFWVGAGRILAGMNVGIWDVNEDIQELIRRGTPVDASRLADPDTPLGEL